LEAAMAGVQDLLSGVLGGGGSGATDNITKLIQPVMDMIQNNGGLQSVLSQLQNSPIGGQVASWIGTGDNQPVSSDDLAAAVGEDKVEALAQESGLPVEEVKGGLSEILPNLVNKLSPGGQIPGADQIGDIVKQIPGAEQFQDQLGSLLGGLLGGGGAAK
jgi:uncharacterized protein YidB (DUF937 family)